MGIHELRCSVYKLREELAKQRQPAHVTAMSRLLAVIDTDDHPYRESLKDYYSRLLECPDFRWPCQGPPAHVEAEFLYRCVPFGALLAETTPRFAPRELDGQVDRGLALERIERALVEAESSAAWIPLTTIATGHYSRPTDSASITPNRRIGWWTDLDFEGAVVATLRKTGVPRNWVSEDSALLRCAVVADVLEVAHTPSVLDGFASEIFLPVDYTQAPSCGYAINISGDPFVLGGKEVVLGPLAVEHIEFRRVSVSQPENEKYDGDSRDPLFVERLERFYQTHL